MKKKSGKEALWGHSGFAGKNLEVCGHFLRNEPLLTSKRMIFLTSAMIAVLLFCQLPQSCTDLTDKDFEGSLVSRAPKVKSVAAGLRERSWCFSDRLCL